MIKIAICDDEQKDREKLQGFIQEFMSNSSKIIFLEEFASGEQLLERGNDPAILFLDIMMGGKDGIQIGNEIKQHNPDVIIIYITNLREKISIAINQIHAFGFLEKPIVKENVFSLLDDAMDCLKQDVRADKVIFMSENLDWKEEIIADFVELFKTNEYISQTDNYFIKDDIVNFIVPAPQSMRGYIFIKMDINNFPKIVDKCCPSNLETGR